MTFHFQNMAPPGAGLRRHSLAARWLRDAQTGKLVRHWLEQPAPQVAQMSDARLRALLSRHAELRSAG